MMNAAKEELANLSSFEEIRCVAEQGWRGEISADVVAQYGAQDAGEALRREAAKWVREVDDGEVADYRPRHLA
jgi:hypothetical protein